MSIYRGEESDNTDRKPWKAKPKSNLRTRMLLFMLLFIVSLMLLACGSSKNGNVSGDSSKETKDVVEAVASESQSPSQTQDTTKEQKTTKEVSTTEEPTSAEPVTEPETTSLPVNVGTDFQFEDTGETKYAYLTFDDGPSDNTYPILDILDQYQVKATFFMVSRSDEVSRQRCKAIADKGHALGMHSHTHVYSELYATLDSFKADVQGIHDWLYEATGQDVKLYRFPGGSSNTVSNVDINTMIDSITSMGYIYYDWNVSSGDASSKPISAEEMIENIKSQSQGYSRVMILMHDTNVKTETVRALPGIIETLQSAGYQIVPIKNNTRPVQHVKAGYMQ
ncbi:MAG: polysaccharide deacetylase [Lachnospiraceae bacterium]